MSKLQSKVLQFVEHRLVMPCAATELRTIEQIKMILTAG